MPISLPFQLLLLGVFNATASSRVSALLHLWATWPNPLAESRSLWCDKVSRVVGPGGRCKVQENPQGLLPTTYNYMLESFCSMLSYTGNVLGITTCFYSYLQGIFANKTRPLLAPVCITAWPSGWIKFRSNCKSTCVCAHRS